MSDIPDSRILIATNPHSTRAGEIASEVVDPIREYLGAHGESALHTIETRSSDFQENVFDVATRLQAGDIVVSCGGDGMASIVGNALILAAELDVKDASLLVAPYGRANDISRHVHGRDLAAGGVVNVLKADHTRPLDTIEIARTGAHTSQALGYVGIGATALASRRVDTPEYRAKRAKSRNPDAMDERLAAITTLLHRSFGYKDGDEARRAHEILFWTVGTLGGNPLETGAQPAMRNRELGPWVLPLNFLYRKLAEVRRGGLRGNVINQRTVTVTSPTLMHADGEVTELPAEARVTLTHRPNNLSVRTATPQVPLEKQG